MSTPSFSFEDSVWSRGFSLVIGVDEVGRGSLAGPVVAGAAAYKYQISDIKYQKENKEVLDLGINDSKKLSAKRRESLVPLIKEHFHFGIGETAVGFINAYGIRPATERAMRSAVVSLLYKTFDKDDNITSKTALGMRDIEALKPYLLLDAFHVKYVPIVGLKYQQAVVKGDEKSITIAAASIIAKVYRDNLMKKLSGEFPSYGWDINSGYGTPRHIDALKKHGATSHHRIKFIESIISA